MKPDPPEGWTWEASYLFAINAVGRRLPRRWVADVEWLANWALYRAWKYYDGGGWTSRLGLQCKSVVLAHVRKEVRRGLVGHMGTRSSAKPDLFSAEESLATVSARSVESELVASDCLNLLREDDRDLVRRIAEGWSHGEIAEALGLTSKTTVAKRVLRLRARAQALGVAS